MMLDVEKSYLCFYLQPAHFNGRTFDIVNANQVHRDLHCLH